CNASALWVVSLKVTTRDFNEYPSPSTCLTNRLNRSPTLNLHYLLFDIWMEFNMFSNFLIPYCKKKVGEVSTANCYCTNMQCLRFVGGIIKSDYSGRQQVPQSKHLFNQPP